MGEGRRATIRSALRAAAGALALAFAACVGRTTAGQGLLGDDLAPASATESPRDGRVVVVTLDGVRWQDVFHGSDPALSGRPSVPADALMPRTRQLVATRGVALGATRAGCGRVHTAGGSNVSLPGYIEIFTGRASRCLDNHCRQVSTSVLDDAARAAGGGGGGAASIGAWDMLANAVTGGGAGVVVSAGRNWPSELALDAEGRLAELVAAGQRADPYPGHGNYRPDAETAAIALEYYRVAAPALFHIGLGDTDEYGHRGDYLAYLDALKHADAVIGAVADLLDTMGETGAKTTVIVAPDHGRNSDFLHHGLFHPESGRAFVLAFGGPVPPRGVACPSRDLTLADIAPTIRVLMGLPRDTAAGGGSPISLVTGAN
jgi:hypothetical protein